MDRPGEPHAPLPAQVTMGLLDLVTSQSMDQDYAHVSARKAAARTADGGEAGGGEGADGPGTGGPSGTTPQSRPSVGVAGLAVVALFGVLVVTAGLQSSRDADDRATGREELLSQIAERRAVVQDRRERAEALRIENERLDVALRSATREGRSLTSRVERLSLHAGSVAVRGPGVRVVVDDAPGATTRQQRVLDRDLQRLTNALWAAGAEAMTVNGKRLTALSAIRQAGSPITVDYEAIRRPYVVEAIGDPDTIPARFVETKHGAEWFDLQRTLGLRFTMTTEGALTLPAADRLDLRHATTTAVPAQ
ncbi:MAG: DUF881 domain-containing protein [Nocardioides sp.]|nr:DUF881 domain-containing protein [Nocardioides sp.]